MTISSKELIEIAIDHINETNADGVVLSKEPNTFLISSESAIDSLTLVRLLLEIERLAEEDYDTPITVVDESAFESEVSPFRTVGSLTKHLDQLLTE